MRTDAPATVPTTAKRPRPRKPTRAADCTCAHPSGGTCRGTWDVVLIGCGAEKAAEPAAAADLYTGSLYGAHRRILTHLGAWPPTAILSAKHGWVEPSKVLEPYEYQPSAAESEVWGDRIAARLFAQQQEKPVVLVLAGATYIDPWTGKLAEEIRDGHIVVDDPLRGLEFGERLQVAAELIAAGVVKNSSRCALHAFMRGWRADLDQRRTNRRLAAERTRRAAAAQLDMFPATDAAIDERGGT